MGASSDGRGTWLAVYTVAGPASAGVSAPASGLERSAPGRAAELGGVGIWPRAPPLIPRERGEAMPGAGAGAREVGGGWWRESEEAPGETGGGGGGGVRLRAGGMGEEGESGVAGGKRP